MIRFLIPHKEKFNKWGEASDDVKNLVEYYEYHGFRQVWAKQERNRKLWNLHRGIINKEDYIKEEVPQELEFDLQDSKLDDVGLSFYPLTPIINNSILGEHDKKLIRYFARAVNPENTNSIIEAMDTELRELMVGKLYNLFLEENPNPDEEQLKLFQESEKVKEKYKLSYRSSIERWANHTMRKEDMKFDMKNIERDSLEKIIVTGDPVVHVNYMEDDYYPESWNEDNHFFLKSTESDCYSEGVMSGYFDYLTMGSILNTYADKLTAEQVVQIESWVNKHFNTELVFNGKLDAITGNRNEYRESLHNYFSFKGMEKAQNRYNSIDENLFRVTTMYFLLPRKVGKLVYKSGDVVYKDIVDEYYKVTQKPKYERGYSGMEEFLIEGEHIEWFYINELWKAIKIDIGDYSANWSTNSTQDTIWVECKKHDIQYSGKHKYGVSLPVFGGAERGMDNETFSITQNTASWQIFFNWIWNRNAQLLATEVGRFFAFNQMAIPHESMGESWGKDNLLKWVMTGRDLGLAPLDLSLNNMGQSGLQLGGGIGQLVDLNRTSDILEKAQLANTVKQECFASVGLTAQHIYGDYSPKQTATSVIQGQQRSSNQIQHIYTRLNRVMKNVRTCMLQTAQYVESNNPYSQVSYLTSDGVREIFNTNTEGFLLHDLEIYVESTLSDIDTLEKIKMYTLQNNTLGADALEIATIQRTSSTPELMDKLRVLKAKKEEEELKQREYEQTQLDKQLQAQREAQEKDLMFKTQESEKDRRNNIDVATVKALGFANDDADAISDEIKEMLRERNRVNEAQSKLELEKAKNEMGRKQVEASIQNDAFKSKLEERIKLKELELKNKELDIRREEVSARNKRTKAID